MGRTSHFEPEHFYEEVKKEMKTLDIRLSHSKRDLRRQSAPFSDDENALKVNTRESDNSEKADSEFQFFASNNQTKKKRHEKATVNVILKANQRNFFARIRSFVSS